MSIFDKIVEAGESSVGMMRSPLIEELFEDVFKKGEKKEPDEKADAKPTDHTVSQTLEKAADLTPDVPVPPFVLSPEKVLRGAAHGARFLEDNPEAIMASAAGAALGAPLGTTGVNFLTENKDVVGEAAKRAAKFAFLTSPAGAVYSWLSRD